MGMHSKKSSDSDLELNKVLYYMSRAISKVISFLFFSFKIIGMENIPKAGSAILASKHTYWFDRVTTGCFIDRVIYTFAKSAFFDRSTLLNRLRRWCLKKVGAFNINRKKDHVGIRPSDIDLLFGPIKKGSLLLLYPEGTRVEDKVGEFEKGLAATVRIQAKMNSHANLPIIPLSPAFSIKPFSSFLSFIPFWRRIKIALVVGEPIYYNGETTREFTRILKEKITECYNKAGSLVAAYA